MPPELKLEVRAVHACSPPTEVAEARLIYYEKLKAGCCPYQSYLQDWQEKGLPICGHTYRDISTLGQWHALVEENNFGSVLHALAADVVRHSGESPRDICLNKLRSYALQAKKKGYTRLLVDTILQDAIEELQGPQVSLQDPLTLLTWPVVFYSWVVQKDMQLRKHLDLEFRKWDWRWPVSEYLPDIFELKKVKHFFNTGDRAGRAPPVGQV